MNAHMINPFAPSPQFIGDVMYQGPQAMTQEINNDLLFVSLMVSHYSKFEGLTELGISKVLASAGYNAIFTEQQVAVLEAVASKKKYLTVEAAVKSPHRQFVLRGLGVLNMVETVQEYIKLVMGAPSLVEIIQDFLRQCMQYEATLRSQAIMLQRPNGPYLNGMIRQHVFGHKVMHTPVLDHGFRPRRPNSVQACSNSVFVYSPDAAPLILNADMETTYHINGFYVLFHMNNFSSHKDVEVEVHESARNDLPGLLATEMDSGIFRRYFDPTQRIKNIEALALVIN